MNSNESKVFDSSTTAQVPLEPIYLNKHTSFKTKLDPPKV